MSLLRKILNAAQGNRRVVMRVSVDHLEAGKAVDLPADVADQLIARGYADGELSRHFEEHELAALRANNQTVVI